MRVDWIPVTEGLPDGGDDVLVTVQRPDEGVESNIQRLGGVRRGLGETAVQHHRLGAAARTI